MPSRHRARVALAAALFAPLATWLGLRAHVVEALSLRAATATFTIARAISPGASDPDAFAVLEPLESTADLAPHDLTGAHENGSSIALLDRSPREPPSSSAGPTITTGGIFVPRARVTAAVKAGIRPGSGGAAPATAWRPAGTLVVGVGTLGVGLRDGDVVTRVGAVPATSVNAVVGAIDAALRAGAPAISAEVWRGRHRIVVTVELPKLRRKASEATPPRRPAAVALTRR
jgi:hypothetical protein